MRVFMAMESDSGLTPGRVLMQDRPIEPFDLPPGIEGEGWTFREADVDPEMWAAQLADELTFEESDAFHRDAWSQNGAPWPSP